MYKTGKVIYLLVSIFVFWANIYLWGPKFVDILKLLVLNWSIQKRKIMKIIICCYIIIYHVYWKLKKGVWFSLTINIPQIVVTIIAFGNTLNLSRPTWCLDGGKLQSQYFIWCTRVIKCDDTNKPQIERLTDLWSSRFVIEAISMSLTTNEYLKKSYICTLNY